MGKSRSSARGRTLVLVLAGMAAGSLLSGPAVAHTGKKISHLTTKHLDAIYLNETQKAADANQLDGLDSSQFLRSNGKAADAELLDGVNGADYLRTTGKAADSELLDGLNSTAFLQGATTYTRHFACAGNTFLPSSSSDFYGTSASLRHPNAGATSTVFRCNVVIPDAAAVTRLDFSVKDSDGTDEVSRAELWQTRLLSSIGTETEMADAGTTGGVATPGNTVLSDTTISSPIIDNGQFSYFLLVGLQGADSDIGVYGAIVTYTISGTAGGG